MECVWGGGAFFKHRGGASAFDIYLFYNYAEHFAKRPCFLGYFVK